MNRTANETVTSNAEAHLAYWANEAGGEATSEMLEQVTNVLVAHSTLEGVDAKVTDLTDEQATARRVLIEALDLNGRTGAVKAHAALDKEWNSYEFAVDAEWDEVEDEPDDEVVEDAPTDSDTNGVLEAVDSALSSLMDTVSARLDEMATKIDGMAGGPPSLVTKAAPPTEDEDETDEVDESGELTIRRYRSGAVVKPRSPKGWKDGRNYTVGVVIDSVHQKNGEDGVGHPALMAHGMTEDEAIEAARSMARRALITASGIKGLHKATQDSDTWAAVAAKAGITEAVIDEFLTGANKYRQQAMRTAVTLRGRLGITDKATLKEAVARILGDAPTDAPSKTETTEVAGIDATELKALRDAGFTAAEALDALRGN